jgi:ubiquinone/menaquinone biosynthesis C-methylase UbiE
MERPLERRTAARTGVVWDAVRALLEDRPDGARILDIGGGTGGFAVRLAGLGRSPGQSSGHSSGHQVSVVDPSPDALAALSRRADEEGVADRVTGLQGDLGDLGDLAPEGGVDLVLCHGVLGLVEDPAAALATIASVLRPGGVLSLLVSQQHAAVLARAMAGHLTQAKALLEGSLGAPGDGADARPVERRFTADQVVGLLETGGYAVTAVHGVRVFSDLVPPTLLDLEPGAGAALLDLERAVATRPEYLTIATQLHALATH